MGGLCEVCDEPLDVLEMMSFALEDLDGPSICDSCLAVRVQVVLDDEEGLEN
jgi:hypothetical protein